jgi:hypothetical protein
MPWMDEQHWEMAWWGDCTNTFGEEAKQISYAHRMGLVNDPVGEHWPGYDLAGKSVLDLGGGPTSLLLKCRNGGRRAVVDPGDYPRWTLERYLFAGIEVYREMAEHTLMIAAFDDQHFDEVWIYNCLQHVENPAAILAAASELSSVLRIFEWLDIPACPGHPWELKETQLDAWIGDKGSTEVMQGENGCWGRAYFGCLTI